MFFSDLGKSLKAYGQAFGILNKYKLWKHLVVPGLISLIYVALLIWGAIAFDDKIAEWMVSWVPFAWLRSLLTWVISGLFWVFAYFFLWLTYRFVVMIILSPFLSKISEKVEFALTGRAAPDTGFSEFFQDILRALVLGVRNLFMELLLTFVGWFIPLFGTVFNYGVSACYAGFGMIDFTLERKRFTVSQSASFMRNHRGLCVGLGLGFQLISLIPIVGWFLAPSLGAVAGTIRVLEVEEEKSAGKISAG